MTLTLDPENVYPSLKEILPEVLLTRIPSALAEEISTRYATLGPKYMTDQQHVDGRYINGCMFKSSANDALEEVVDAVFNILVLIFKTHNNTGVVPNEKVGQTSNAYIVLLGLLEIYSSLAALRAEGN